MTALGAAGFALGEVVPAAVTGGLRDLALSWTEADRVALLWHGGHALVEAGLAGGPTGS